MRISMGPRQWIFLKSSFLTLILCLVHGSLVVFPAHGKNISEKEVLRPIEQEIGKNFEKNFILKNSSIDDFQRVIALNKEKEAPEKTKANTQKAKSTVTLNPKELVFSKKTVDCPVTEWGDGWTVQEDGSVKWPDSEKFRRIEVKSLSNTKTHLGYLFKKPKGK